MKLGDVTYNAIVLLVGRGPMSACELGAELWRSKKRGRVVSSNGGGDYAAQMLLGRLRKQGFAETVHSEGSSRWQATGKGRNALAVALTKSGAPREVRTLRRTAQAGGRAIDPRDLTADVKLGQTGRRGAPREEAD